MTITIPGKIATRQMLFDRGK